VVLSVALFASLVSSRSLWRAALLCGDAFPKEEQVAKRIAEEKFFHAPGLRPEWRLNGTRRHILLIQRLDSGDANPTDPVTVGNMEMQTDPISFDDGKLPGMRGGRKAQLRIKGQGLLHLCDRNPR